MNTLAVLIGIVAVNILAVFFYQEIGSNTMGLFFLLMNLLFPAHPTSLSLIARLGRQTIRHRGRISRQGRLSSGPRMAALSGVFVGVDITQKGVTFRKSAELGSKVNGKRLRSRQRLRLR